MPRARSRQLSSTARSESSESGLAQAGWGFDRPPGRPRRGRDLNPRGACNPYSLSRRVPSTARPPLPENARLSVAISLPTCATLPGACGNQRQRRRERARRGGRDGAIPESPDGQGHRTSHRLGDRRRNIDCDPLAACRDHVLPHRKPLDRVCDLKAPPSSNSGLRSGPKVSSSASRRQATAVAWLVCGAQ